MSWPEHRYVAGVELGGTKCIALRAEGRHILERVTVPTTTPDETLAALNGQLRAWHAARPFAALGIATFGPVKLDPASADFGCILRTPKPGWSGAPVAARIAAGLPCRSHIDTDVNAAALAEHLWGAGQGCDSLCYVTIGTGVGVGLLIDGKPVHGALHPELGHLRIRRSEEDRFPGHCAFHGDCLEGLVSGPALAARFEQDMINVVDDHPAWRHVASDLSELAMTLLLATAPQRILFGGTVSLARAFLLPAVREMTAAKLGSYLVNFDPKTATETIQLAQLGTDAGPLGAAALALTEGWVAKQMPVTPTRA